MRVRADEVDYYTQPERGDLRSTVRGVHGSGSLGRFGHCHGAVEVENRVLAFKRKRTWPTAPSWGTSRSTCRRAASPPRRCGSSSTKPCSPTPASAPTDLPGTLHAAEHTSIAMLPLFAICDRWDIGGLSTPFHPETGGPVWFIYDGYPGGAGIAPLG